MNIQADIVAYDTKGKLVLVAEVKNKRGTGGDGARRQLAAYAEVTKAPYRLLALPDHFYLWVNKQPDLENPDYIVDPAPFLRPYWGVEGPSEYLSETSFEMIVEAWLATLTWVDELPVDAAESGSWLLESGLFDALKRGHLAFEVPL